VTSEAMTLLRGLVVDEDGRRWGETAEPWQEADAQAILDTSPGAIRRHFLVRPKDGRKTSDLAAVNIVALLEQTPRHGKLYALASDRDQVGLLLDSVREFQARTPGLGGALSVYENKVTTSKETTLEALPADAASAQGIRGHLITADEIHEWTDTRATRRLWSNVVQGLEKSLPNGTFPRFAAITNAGSPHSLAGRARKKAKDSEEWRLSEVEGPLPWKTEQQLAALRDDCDTDAEYERLHLNRWTEGPDRLATLEDIKQCATLNPELPLPPAWGQRYVIGVDLSLRRDLSAAAVCHAEYGERKWVDGREQILGHRVVVDRLMTWRAPRGRDVDLGEIEMWLDIAARQYGAQVVMESYQAGPIQQGLLRRGIDAQLIDATQARNSRQVVLLMSLLHDKAIALPNDPELLTELTNVPIVESQPNVYKLGDQRVAGLGHHDRTTAISIAVHELMAGGMSRPAPQRVVVHGWRDPAPGGGRTDLLEKLASVGDPGAKRALERAGHDGRTVHVYRPSRR
jgi:hypothetical protein